MSTPTRQLFSQEKPELDLQDEIVSTPAGTALQPQLLQQLASPESTGPLQGLGCRLHGGQLQEEQPGVSVDSAQEGCLRAGGGRRNGSDPKAQEA